MTPRSWSLADVLAVEHAGWPERHHLEAELAEWLQVDAREAAMRNRRILAARRRDVAVRARARAERMLAELPKEPWDVVVARGRAWTDEDEAPPGDRRLVHGVWRWGAA